MNKQQQQTNFDKALDQGFPTPYFDRLEQGKKEESTKFASILMALFILAFLFLFCFYTGHKLTKNHYEQQMKEHDSIAYQTALTDLKNGK